MDNTIEGHAATVIANTVLRVRRTCAESTAGLTFRGRWIIAEASQAAQLPIRSRREAALTGTYRFISSGRGGREYNGMNSPTCGAFQITNLANGQVAFVTKMDSGLSTLVLNRLENFLPYYIPQRVTNQSI